jgi:hypothetical protein
MDLPSRCTARREEAPAQLRISQIRKQTLRKFISRWVINVFNRDALEGCWKFKKHLLNIYCYGIRHITQ